MLHHFAVYVIICIIKQIYIKIYSIKLFDNTLYNLNVYVTRMNNQKTTYRIDF
jgi:hypothetical protein